MEIISKVQIIGKFQESAREIVKLQFTHITEHKIII